MYDGKYNPSIARGDSEPIVDYLARMREFVQQLIWRSDGHRMWYTHKNPYGCWICDLIYTVEQYSGALDVLLQERAPDLGPNYSTTGGTDELEDEKHELEDK